MVLLDEETKPERSGLPRIIQLAEDRDGVGRGRAAPGSLLSKTKVLVLAQPYPLGSSDHFPRMIHVILCPLGCSLKEIFSSRNLRKQKA